jgi:hypothetical protein
MAFFNRILIMDFIILFFFIILLNQLFISNIVKNNQSLSRKLLNRLFFYHLLFFVIYLLYAASNRSDSFVYYQSAQELGDNWSVFLFTGTQFIDNFSAPFVMFGFSYESMMLLFSWFGYIGFVYAYMFFKENIPINVNVFGKFDLLQLILFLPNMHFWTSSLGKGSLIFMGLMMFTYSLKSPKKRLILLIIGGYFVYMIRPPVMLFVLTGVMIGLLTGREKISVGLKIVIVSASLLFLYNAASTILSTVKIENTDNVIDDFKKNAEVQSDRLEASAGSGVAMQSYPLLFKLFTFWFRPLFIDSPSALGLFSSAENLIYLLLFLKICNKRFLSFIRKAPYLVKMSGVTFLLASYAMTFVMSNLGIIMRQKSMVMYFGFFVIYYFLAEEKWKKEQKENKLTLNLETV